ncbi:MAG: hypothetical protein J5859_01300 [Clostridia bacterium]|nr:hypothetical protein [Clostridia bacterium]
MLPFALAMLEIRWPDGTVLETRILEPRADGVTFRVSRKRSLSFDRKPAECAFTFLRFSDKEYVSVTPKDFALAPLPADPEDIPDTVTYLLTSQDEAFLRELSRLARDYTIPPSSA